MRVLLNNGFINTEWEGKPDKLRLNNDDLVKTLPRNGWEFFDELRNGDYDANEPYVDLRYSAHKVPYNPYYVYRTLWWVVYWAQECDIEIDDSLMDTYKNLRETYYECFEKCSEAYEARMTEIALEKWDDKHSGEESDDCSYCGYCADVIDGDLYCERYRTYLDVKVAEKITPAGRHLLFASHGLKCDKCKEQKKVDREEEKAKFVKDYIGELSYLSIENEVKKEMGKMY